MSITFTVAGVPAPQGSKTRTRYGMREDNPNTRPWRSAVAWEATAAMQGSEPLTGPLVLEATFYFPRPKAHYHVGKRAGQLRSDAPTWHTVKPDGDKLVRAIGDALTGIVCRDDSQFALGRWRKLYGPPSAVVTVRPAQNAEP